MNKVWKLSHWLYDNHMCLIARLFEVVQDIIFSNHISAKCDIGGGTYFFHYGLGCVIHPKAIIGKNCVIFNNVVIGSKWSNGICEGGAPTIEDNVLIGAGAVILGNINIGKNAIIGANAVVTKNVPSNIIALGVPAIYYNK